MQPHLPTVDLDPLSSKSTVKIPMEDDLPDVADCGIKVSSPGLTLWGDMIMFEPLDPLNLDAYICNLG